MLYALIKLYCLTWSHKLHVLSFQRVDDWSVSGWPYMGMLTRPVYTLTSYLSSSITNRPGLFYTQNLPNLVAINLVVKYIFHGPRPVTLSAKNVCKTKSKTWCYGSSLILNTTTKLWLFIVQISPRDVKYRSSLDESREIHFEKLVANSDDNIIGPSMVFYPRPIT